MRSLNLAADGSKADPVAAQKPRAAGSVRLASFRDALAGMPVQYREQAEAQFASWEKQGCPIPSDSPQIRFETRWLHEHGLYSCRIGIFYRAFCVVCHGVAYWFFIGNHPDRGEIPVPSRSFDPDLKKPSLN